MLIQKKKIFLEINHNQKRNPLLKENQKLNLKILLINLKKLMIKIQIKI